MRGGGEAVKYFSYQFLETYEIQRRIGYFTIPLLLKYRSEWGRVNPYVLSGPTLSYPITDPSHFYPSVLGATLGGGLEVTGLTPFTVLIDIRYSYDLTHTFNDWADDIDVKSNAIDFGIGLGF